MVRARLMLIVSIGLAGCSLPARTADFNSVDPAERTLALGRAAAETDDRSIPALIRLLESDDPAERMLAIGVLEERTGQTLGYEYSANEERRALAVERWIAWHKGAPGGGAGATSAQSGR